MAGREAVVDDDDGDNIQKDDYSQRYLFRYAPRETLDLSAQVAQDG